MPDSVKKRPWLRRCLWALAGAGVLVVAAIILVETPPGKAGLAAIISRMVTNNTAYRLDIRGISGLLPAHIRVDAIKVDDPRGDFIDISGLDLRLSFWQLLRGRIDLRQANVDRVTLWRRPIPKRKWRIPRIPSLPVWPKIGALCVEQLVLKEEVLGRAAVLTLDGTVLPVEGKPFPRAALQISTPDSNATRAVLSFEYRDNLPQLLLKGYDEVLLPEVLDAQPPFVVEVDGRGDRADWKGNLLVTSGGDTLVEGNARLMEGANSSVQAALTFHASRAPVIKNYAPFSGNRINASLSASIDGRGLLSIASCDVKSDLLALSVSGQIQLEEKQNTLDLRFAYADISKLPGMIADKGPLAAGAVAQVEGPFNAPAITVRANIGDAPFLEADLHGDLGALPALKGSINVKPGRLPLRAMPYVGEERVQAGIDLAYDEEVGEARIHKLDVSAAGASLQMKGRAAPHLPALDLTAHLDAPDLVPVGDLLGQPLKGAAVFDLTAAGDNEGLSFSLTMNGTALEAAPVQLQAAALTVVGNCKTWTTLPPEGLQAKIAAQTQGLVVSERVPGDWGLDALVEMDAVNTLKVSSLILTDGNARLEGGGDYDIASKRFALTLEAVAASLDKLPLFPEGMPRGSLQAAIIAEGTLQPLDVEVKGNGTLDALTGLPTPAAALAGKTLKAVFETQLTGDRITLPALDISGGSFDAKGSASYAFNTKTVESSVRLMLPELQTLGAAFNQNLSGAASLDVDLSGSLDALTAKGSILGEKVVLNNFPAARVRVDLDASGLDGPRRDILLNALVDTGSEALEARTTVAADSGKVLLKPLEIRMGDNRIAGSASYALNTRLPEATLDVSLKDLAALGRLAGMPLSGAAEGTVSLKEGVLAADMEARSFSYGETHIKTASVKAHMQQGKGEYSGTVEAEADGVCAGSMDADAVKIEVAGGFNEARGTARVQGRIHTGAPEPHPFTLKAESLLFAREQRVVLEAVNGMLGDFEYGLEEPVRLAAGEGGVSVEPLTLRFGTGNIRAEGRQKGDALSGKLRLEAFPLAAGVLFMEPALSGTLDGEVMFGGSLSVPEINAAFSLHEGRLHTEKGEGLAPLSADITAGMTQSGFSATLKADMEGILHLEGQARLPVRLQVQPWLLEMPQEKGLSGDMSFDLQCEPLLGALGLERHSLAGNMKGAFTLAGGLASPDIRGEAVMRDAHYENSRTGTRLERLNVTVAAEGDTVRLAECSADTDKQGRMTATGEVRLRYAEDFPFSGLAVFKEARFADLDYMNGRMNGEITAEGTLKDILVKGDIKITPVQVSMPDELPVKEPATLAVTERRDGKIISEEPKKASGAASMVRFDINCDIPGKAYARAPILDSEWGGKLHVGGTLAAMKIDGRLKVLRGHLDFLNRRFVLRDSALLFLDGSPEKPYLDMLAVVETPTLTARLTLKGELEDVKMELTSEPELPQDEILAQILFGRNLSRLSPVQAIQLARVAAMFNQGLSGIPLFSGNIKLPGIDRMDIRTGERADETTVGMGKYFTDSVYVEVEQGTTTDSGKVSVEVEVTPQISVKGDADAKERSGVGLFWKKDY